jgi:hypothetical protein
LNVVGNLNEIFWGGFETRDRVLNFGRDDHEELGHAAGCLWGKRGRGRVGVWDDCGDGLTLFATEASVRLFAHEMCFGHRALRGHAFPLGRLWDCGCCGGSNCDSFLGEVV